MGKKAQVSDSLIFTESNDSVVIEMIEELNRVRSTIYQLLVGRYRFKHVDKLTFKILVRYWYEFGPEVMEQWMTQAHESVPGDSLQDFGRYISGIRRSKLETYDKNHHLGLS